MDKRVKHNRPLRNIIINQYGSYRKFADECRISEYTVKSIIAGDTEGSRYTRRVMAEKLGLTYRQVSILCLPECEE